MNAYKPADLFGVPDDLTPSLEETKKTRRTQKKTLPIIQAKKKTEQVKSIGKGLPALRGSVHPTQSASGQGFLPGLSRRGRPRLITPISAVDRTAEHRRQRIANGAKRVEIILEANVSKALDRLADHHGEPRSDVIANLIRKAAARLKD